MAPGLMPLREELIIAYYRPSRRLHWMLYDETDRVSRNSEGSQAPPPQWISSALSSSSIIACTGPWTNIGSNLTKRAKFWSCRELFYIQIAFISLRCPRIDNRPNASEVGTIIHVANRITIDSREFYIYDKDHQRTPKALSIYSPIHKPLSYPILFFARGIRLAPQLHCYLWPSLDHETVLWRPDATG